MLIGFLSAGSLLASAQADQAATYIFIPHPRSDDNVNQSVLPGIEQIDFSLYEMILLGGDLTYNTSVSKASMDYCDSLFSLGDPNTLWTMGNHDLASRSLVGEYTRRPSWYSHSNNNIVFLVLDTEIDAGGFSSSHISGDQLSFVAGVCDTIAVSDYLIVLHHRLLWMIGNDYFDPWIDSVAQSTRQLDTSNFNTVVYPLLQQAKNRGVPVICLGGDRSMVNLEYTPEDSILFIASTMVPEFTDAQNDVVILHHNKQTGLLDWEFIPLDQVVKNPPVSSHFKTSRSSDALLKVDYNRAILALDVSLINKTQHPGLLEIYSLSGQKVFSGFISHGDLLTIAVREKGLYIVRLNTDKRTESQRIYVY